MDQSETLGIRVTELEMHWMQLQRDFDALNGIVLAQQQELATWRAAFARLEAQMAALADPEPPRDPLAERPPHY